MEGGEKKFISGERRRKGEGGEQQKMSENLHCDGRLTEQTFRHGGTSNGGATGPKRASTREKGSRVVR